MTHTGLKTQDPAASDQEAALMSPCLIVEASVFIERGLGGQTNEGKVLLSQSTPPLTFQASQRHLWGLCHSQQKETRRPRPLFSRRLGNVPQGPRMLREVGSGFSPWLSLWHPAASGLDPEGLLSLSLSLFFEISTRHLR